MLIVSILMLLCVWIVIFCYVVVEEGMCVKFVS